MHDQPAADEALAKLALQLRGLTALQHLSIAMDGLAPQMGPMLDSLQCCQLTYLSFSQVRGSPLRADCSWHHICSVLQAWCAPHNYRSFRGSVCEKHSILAGPSYCRRSVMFLVTSCPFLAALMIVNVHIQAAQVDSAPVHHRYSSLHSAAYTILRS